MINTEERTLKALEWATILQELAKFATCEEGKIKCLNAEIFCDAEKIKKELKNTTEGKYLLDCNIHPPLGGIRTVREFLPAAKVGKTLKPQELIDIASTMGAARRLKTFFDRYKEETPQLQEIASGLYQNKDIEDEITQTFDEGGNVHENATPELKRLSLSEKDQTVNLKNKLNSLITSPSFSKLMQENVYTIRNDRFVVPIKAEHKSHVAGIVHDISASGSTIFIEPRAIVEMNNKLKEIELKIDAEIKKILAELSAKVGEISQELEYTLDLLADLDFAIAKSKYSLSIQGIEPEINDKNYLSLKYARHPILMKVVENVIPNDIEIGKTYGTMIITGPNTGGKTVFLKTAGICTLMTKAGLHVPALEANIYPFKNIFADIGDEQSIIQSLSTFSGHIKNIINIVKNTDEKTLILLDELGAGTDPAEGTALAEAILHEINSKGAKAIVTTHFSELKTLAYTEHGFYNASVEFNTETLAPTYKLIMGVPGKSNAVYIAEKLGMPREIAEKARELYLNKSDLTGQMLEGLQNTQQELSKNSQIAVEKKISAEKLEKELSEELNKLKDEKKKILNVYKKKFDNELSKAKQEIKEILEETRRAKSEKVSRRSMSRIGNTEADFRNISGEEGELLEPNFKEIDWEKIQIGDPVIVKHLDQQATLAAFPDKNNNVTIEMGLLKTTLKKDELGLPNSGKLKKSKPAITLPQNISFKRHELNNTLDLRGLNAEDAIDKTEFFLDEASLANLSPVYIIHGHGTGILRKVVREYLKTSPYVSKFRAGEKCEGGDGVSVVELS